MQRFMTFVNGSNLFTTFKHIDLYIDDYEELYQYIFEQTVAWWRTTLAAASPPPAQHVRVYWHVVDSLDDWDLHNQFRPIVPHVADIIAYRPCLHLFRWEWSEQIHG